MSARIEKTPSVAGALAGIVLALGVTAPTALAFEPYVEEWIVPGLPQDVEVDPSGRVWVSCEDDSVRVYSPTGGVQLFAFGGTGAGDGEFQTPYGIAFDAVGDALVCDYAGTRIEKFTSEGVFLFSWPIPSSRADHVAIDAVGDVYVTGYTDASVHKYDAFGTPLLDWGSAAGVLTAGVIEAGGVVSVVGWDLPLVEQYLTDGTYLGTFDAETLNGVDIESDPLGQLWVADFSGNAVRIFASDGTPVEVFGAPGAGPGEFNGVIGIALASDGSVYVADYLNSRIQRFGGPTAGVGDGAGGAGGGAGGANGGLAMRAIAPNPSRGPVELVYTLASHEERVAITVADVAGRTVATLADERVAAGSHRRSLELRDQNGEPLPAGVYLVRVETAGAAEAGRVVLVR